MNTTLENLTKQYLELHSKSQDTFWTAKMGLTGDLDHAEAELAAAELKYQEFYEDASWLRTLAGLESQVTDPNELRTLKSWQRSFQASAIEDEAVRKYSAELLQKYLDYAARKAKYNWGYTDPTSGEFVPTTSNALPNIVYTHPDEAVRKAAYEALLKFEQFTIDIGFLDLVRGRNEFARMMGYATYYDLSVERNEGISKKEIFALLGDLEQKTREHTKNVVEKFIRTHGEAAREPWNFSHMRSGSLVKEFDPYLQFEDALERWVRAFSALGIRFRGASLTLDLIDRTGKYENGFMHLPSPAHATDGTWHPARINFCSHAIPNKIGMGERGLNTLYHEGGHAAHFANITAGSPAHSGSPYSHGYTETQSMFCDRILRDPDWSTRYAHMPFELLERDIRNFQPFAALRPRSIMSLSFFERALYELPDAELTRENVTALARSCEKQMLFTNGSSMPALAATHPHDSPCMSHGYVLALIAVYQTREYFRSKYGYILDNSNVGPELASAYWSHGNSKSFFEMIGDLTGTPYSVDAIVREITRPVEETVEAAKAQIAKLAEIPESTSTDLDAHVRVIHGKEQIAEWSDGNFAQANEAFKAWVRENYPKGE
jgi:oligoendopeptidase F